MSSLANTEDEPFLSLPRHIYLPLQGYHHASFLQEIREAQFVQLHYCQSAIQRILPDGLPPGPQHYNFYIFRKLSHSRLPPCPRRYNIYIFGI